MLAGMNWFLSSGWHDVALPIVVAFVTAVIAARVERRKIDRNDVWRARLQLRDDLLRLVTLTIKLSEVNPSDDFREPVRTSLVGERERWLRRIDEISQRLIDDGDYVALSYLNLLGVQPLIIRCVGLIRMVWLSDRTEERKLELIQGIAGGLRDVLFIGRLAAARGMQANHARLVALLDEIDGQTTEPLRIEWISRNEQRLKRQRRPTLDR